MIIYGAGLAGLLAGCAFQTATIHEAGPPTQAHKALLRFRGTSVSDLTGIEFRKVAVHKGIWMEGAFHQPSIQLANYYSKKVLGRYQDRSIWKLDTVDRYIAPENFITLLQERCAARIFYQSPLTAEHLRTAGPTVISTVPMDTMARFVGGETWVTAPVFHFEPITVRRWRLKGADLFQTIYFPDPLASLYRVSITGDLIIAEYAGLETNTAHHDARYNFWQAFGIPYAHAEPLESITQRYGKIAPIENAWRHRFMFELSTRYKIFSLGRFGTWRNILLDDVVHDLSAIRKMMVSTPYESLKQIGNAT